MDTEEEEDEHGGHGQGNVPITSKVTVYTRATAAREESEVLVCTHHAFDTSPQSAVYPALGEMGMQKDADAADADAEQMQSSRRRPGSGPSMRAAMGHEVHGVRWDGSGLPLLVRRRTSGGQQRVHLQSAMCHRPEHTRPGVFIIANKGRSFFRIQGDSRGRMRRSATSRRRFSRCCRRPLHRGASIRRLSASRCRLHHARHVPERRDRSWMRHSPMSLAVRRSCCW